MKYIYIMIVNMILLTGAGIAGDRPENLLYVLRDNPNLQTWCLSFSQPWKWGVDQTGAPVLTRWDTNLIGSNAPAMSWLDTYHDDPNVTNWLTLWSGDVRRSVKQTPQWIALTNDIAAANATFDLYSIVALTNAIAATTGTTKTALTEVKKCIAQAHDEAQALHKEIKDLKTILGKYLAVEP
jgi:hypothetical protein